MLSDHELQALRDIERELRWTSPELFRVFDSVEPFSDENRRKRARARMLVASAAVAGLALFGPRTLNEAETTARGRPPLAQLRGVTFPSVLTARVAVECRRRRPGGIGVMMLILYAVEIAIGLAVLWLVSNLRVIKQYERGVVYRFGRVESAVRGPGLTWLIPIADRLDKVNMQIITMPIPAQDGITRDNVTVRVDAVIYFKVDDPVRAAVDVQDYMSAVGQLAQTSLRSIIGKSELDDLLSNREGLNQGLELMIDSPALGWGIHIDRVEIKDVVLPDSMKRSMSRQAEAERERRARVITADGELQASDKLAQAAEVMAEHPAALQLRLLQTVVEVAAEKNSTLVLPFPVELLRFLEKATPQPFRPKAAAATTPAEPAPLPNGQAPRVDTAPIPDDPRGLPLESIAGQPFRLNQ